MTNHLEDLARRLEKDPFFLACPLSLYAGSERLDDGGLAARLGCSREDLVVLRLCRAQAAHPEQFQADIDRIARRAHVPADLLAEVVRRGQAIFSMTREGRQSRPLLAARDADSERDGKQPEHES